ncbi:hypothetical protein BKI52_11070 [marine bacterium AO1-C]|nr:hypothetical protein BKI52_11070 [marine bacterium AO1-C]
MGASKQKGVFYDLCQKYKTWIIEYNSSNIGFPVYMVWLTDGVDDNQDKFIINEEDQIIAATKPEKLLQYLAQGNGLLLDADNTQKWLLHSTDIPVYPSYECPIDWLIDGVNTKRTTQEWFSEMTNFINFFRDYGEQLKDDMLIKLYKTPELQKAWDFFYEEMFWPEFKTAEKTDRKTDRETDKKNTVVYQTDFEQLAQELNLLITVFENNIEIIEEQA